MKTFTVRLLILSALSFALGFLVGCGDITATMVEPPPAAAGPDAGAQDSLPATLADAGAGVDSRQGTDTTDAAAAGGETAAIIPPDAGAGELGAPEHPALHCQGASGDYRLTVCKPGCGTCQKIGEASTFAAGCWTSDDFHCVDSCGDCR